MVLDTSALAAIVFEEPPMTELVAKLKAARDIQIGSPSYFETRMVVLSRRGPDAVKRLERILERSSTEVTEFTRDHAIAATEAFQRFGKGWHPAGLNFGDCMAYAVAKVSGLPLLFTGDDFSKTDVDVA
ncbi:MAG: type II toxin-antitoxin system VapC family toxin [Fimbriimonadaceae bacterium]